MNRATADTLAQLARELAEQGRPEEADAVRNALNQLGRPSLLTTGEAAERLGVSVPTVRRWAERGVLSATDTGTRLLVSEESVNRLIRIRRNLAELDAEGNPTPEEIEMARSPHRGDGDEKVA